MENILDFNGKIVFVSGSTRGIGRAIAETFAARGAHVILNSRTEEHLERALAEMRAKGYHADGFAGDVGNFDDTARIVSQVGEKFGDIDTVVNNAGVVSRGLVEEVRDGDWDTVLRTNLKGAFNVCKAAVPSMKKQRYGNIINIASQAVVFGSLSGGTPYAASKGGIVSFTRALANEVGEFNVRVNAVLPGLIETDMTKAAIANPILGWEIIKETALRRVGQPHEVAAACLFLASDLASFVTGEILTVNGGLPSILFL